MKRAVPMLSFREFIRGFFDRLVFETIKMRICVKAKAVEIANDWGNGRGAMPLARSQVQQIHII